MISLDEDALICDFAETYQILNFRALPLQFAATLAVGLRENSRIKMRLSGTSIDYSQTMMAIVVDRLNFLSWAQTEDGAKGNNRPKSVLKTLLGEPDEESELETFETPEEFRKKLEMLKGD